MRLRARISTLFTCAILAACSSGGEQQGAPESAPAAQPSVGSEVPSQAEDPGGTVEAPASEDAPQAPAGRLAFIACESERNPICTKEYRPVCGEVDNGIRCVTTPCNSTDQREFGNACTACAEAKTTGYWPVPCAELTTSAP